MKKIEWVYREILYQVIEKKRNFLTQINISKKCDISISTVNYALSFLENMNTIEKKPRGFRVIDAKKILLYWASIRNLKRDIIYQTNVDLSTNEIEKNLPQVIFTAYSAYKFRFKDVPSDYSEIIIYSTKEKIKERFPPKKGKVNLIVLKEDKHLSKFKNVPLAQIFVDLWNLNTWYAKEFIKKLEGKINGILE